MLIETQGEVCLLPLPGDAAERCSRRSVRSGTQSPKSRWSCRSTAPAGREAEQKARAYQALVAQAEIELAFHSPETVGSWHARWSDRVAEHDLETLFWQWGERFPSLAGMERWQWQDMPFWQV
ncbi:plasmid SOS inhibition protein A, partial [Escherichia coli]|uniref:plasmid SOS inhibition protein A n=1 Tax=Escherichia coli TaxID=562 RepID=UPI0020197A22